MSKHDNTMRHITTERETLQRKLDKCEALRTMIEEELMGALRNHRNSSVVYWSGLLAKEAGELVEDCLSDEAQRMAADNGEFR